MALYNKFETFIGDLGDKVHDLDADAIKVYLSNAAPSASADSIKTDLAEITAENGYPSGGTDITAVWSETGGVGSLTATNVTFTASGGSFGPFQYAVIYNDTPSAPVDPLIAWFDYGAATTVLDGEDFQVNFGANVLQVS
jgi:hypothetical protein